MISCTGSTFPLSNGTMSNDFNEKLNVLVSILGVLAVTSIISMSLGLGVRAHHPYPLLGDGLRVPIHPTYVVIGLLGVLTIGAKIFFFTRAVVGVLKVSP